MWSTDPIANKTSTGWRYLQTDHLGTPQLAITNTGSASSQRRMAAFGSTREQGERQSSRFPGQLEDRESGTHYNYFRDYEPGTGRYVESDPIGLFGGMNAYSYADLNTLLLSDSLGLASETQGADCCRKTPPPVSIRKKGFGGFVACCGGQQFVCTVVPAAYSTEGKKAIANCFAAHEIEHTKDPLVSCDCSDPSPHAAGTEQGMGVQAECRAYRVSLGCLEKKNICRKRNDKCRREVKKMIKDHLEFGRVCVW